MMKPCPLCQKWIDALDDAMHRLELKGQKLLQAKAENGRLTGIFKRALECRMLSFPGSLGPHQPTIAINVHPGFQAAFSKLCTAANAEAAIRNAAAAEAARPEAVPA